MAAVVDRDACTGCGNCVEICPVEAIEIQDEKAVVNNDECVDCGSCESECPVEAIKVE